MDQEEDTVDVSMLAALADMLELLETSPPLGRNDLCLCGSGLKYKKCCVVKTKKPTHRSTPSISFAVKTDALTPAESQNDFPALPPEDEELMAVLYHDFTQHPEVIVSEDCEYFQQLFALQVKHPKNPVILNYILKGYDCLGLQAKLEELIVTTYEKFPGYLFAQTARANLYLQEGFPEKALEIFKGSDSLKQLYPHRSVFHITEFRMFEHCMVGCFCKTNDFEQAEIHLQIMQEVLEEDDPLLLYAQQKLKTSRALHKLDVGMSRLPFSAKKNK